MDPIRFIQVYIVQGFFVGLYLWFGIRVIKRDTKRINLILSLFYIITAIGFFLNIIYANIYDESIVYLLHFLTYYILCLSLAFILIFLLIIQKGEEFFDTKKQILLILIHSSLLLGLWFIPGGILINTSTNWIPVWSWSFLIYSYIICTFLIIIPSIYISVKMYKSFKNPELKKRWLFFFIGILTHFALYYGTSLSNTLNEPTFRTIWAIISLGMLCSSYLIYFGVAKKIE